MRESKFNTEIVNSIKSKGYFAYKIPDTPASMIMGLRYSPEKPCDTIACINGAFIAIESKQIKTIEGIALRHFRDTQVESLDTVVKNKGIAFALINVRVPKDKELGRLNYCLGLDWAIWGPKLKNGVKLTAKDIREMLTSIKGMKGCAYEPDLHIFISKGFKDQFDISFLELRTQEVSRGD